VAHKQASITHHACITKTCIAVCNILSTETSNWRKDKDNKLEAMRQCKPPRRQVI